MTTAAGAQASSATASRSGDPGRGAAVRLFLRRSPAASLVAALACVAAAAALATIARGEVWSLAPAPQVLVDATVGITYPVIAVVVLLARATGRGTRALAWVLLGSGAASAGAALATSVALTASGPGHLADVMVQLQSWLWVPGFMPLLTLVPLLYPDGLLPGRLWRVVVLSAVTGMVLFATGVALHPEDFHGTATLVKPVTADGLSRLVTPAGAVLVALASVASIGSLVLRFRRSGELRRRQIVVLLAAAGVLLAVTVVQGLVPAPVDVIAQAGAVALMPVAIGVAVTRHRLYDLDTAVCRALAAASLAVCLTGVYLSVFAVLQAIGDRQSALSAALAAGLTGAMIQPLARRLSAAVDRLFYGDRADPYVVTTRLASRLTESGLDIGDVPGVVCETVVSSLRLGSAEVRLLVDGTERQLAHIGHHPGGAGERFALRHRGDTAGWLVVGPRPGERSVTAQDAAILSAIADLVAPSIAALQLHQELQRSRELLVSAREAERLRLRRELHDGLGATLAGLRLQVESAQALVAEPAAHTLLAAAGGSVSQAVAEVRAISDGLRPPGIDDLGLAQSLELLAERLKTPDLAVAVELDDLSGIDPAAEVATYRIAAEALANVARHARASRLTLTVRSEPDALTLVVADDGVGPEAVARHASDSSGLGIPSMRRRAEEIGGRLELVPAASGRGTQLRAVLPRTLAGAR